MAESTLEIINKLGLHARAASKLASLCSRFGCKITFFKGDAQKADGKSIMGLMLLAAGKGTSLRVICDGDDADNALAAVTELFANRFDEAE